MLGAGDVWRLDRIQLDEIPRNHHEDGLEVLMKYLKIMNNLMTMMVEMVFMF